MASELLIERVEGSGDWVRLDLGEDVPAMVFQINDLTELTDRRASYSQAINLPVTPYNCRVLGFVNEFDARSQSPYSVYPCRLYSNGLQVIGDGFRLEIRSIKDTIRCQIVSNVKSLFEVLKDTPMSETVYPGVDVIDWTIEDCIAANTGNGQRDYFYGIANLGIVDTRDALNGAGLTRVTQIGSSVNIQHIMPLSNYRPYIPIYGTAKAILAQHGYALQTDLINVPNYEPAYFSLNELEPGDDSFERLNGTITFRPRNIVRPAAYPTYIAGPTDSIQSSTLLSDEIIRASHPDPDPETGQLQNYGIEYTSPGNLSVRFKFTAISTPSTMETEILFRGRRRNSAKESEGDFQIEFEESLVGNEVSYTTDTIEMSTNEVLFLDPSIQASGNTTVSARIDVIVSPSENKVCANGRIYPFKSTGFATQYDFIKFFIQAYGLTVGITPEENILQAYTLHEVFRRITAGNFYNWSNKLDISVPPDVSFRVPGYAQRNLLKYGVYRKTGVDSIEDSGEYDSGTVAVSNDTLLSTRDLLTLPVESSKLRPTRINSLIQGVHSAEIPTRISIEKITYVNGTSETTIFKTKSAPPKMHIVFKSRGLDGFSNGNVSVAYSPRVVRSLMQAIAVPPVSAQYLTDTFFGPLERILNPVRTVECEFNLTALDIADMDLFTPVYVEAFGDYFLIQKINNYTGGGVTTCNLLCLNVAE